LLAGSSVTPAECSASPEAVSFLVELERGSGFFV